MDTIQLFVVFCVHSQKPDLFSGCEFLHKYAAPPTIFSFGTNSPLTKAFVLIAPFLDQTNTIVAFTSLCYRRLWSMSLRPSLIPSCLGN